MALRCLTVLRQVEKPFPFRKERLALVEEDGVVGVHDRVRPFVSAEVICELLCTRQPLCRLWFR